MIRQETNSMRRQDPPFGRELKAERRSICVRDPRWDLRSRD